MDLIRTVGIGIDPAPARIGAAQAASAFEQVAQAARNMGGTAQAATRALGPLGSALEVAANALSAIDPSSLVRGLNAASTPFDTLKTQISSASAEAEDLRKELGALTGALTSLAAGGGAASAARTLAPLSAEARALRTTVNSGATKASDRLGQMATSDRDRPSAVGDALVDIKSASQKAEGFAIDAYSGTAAKPRDPNFAAMPKDISATSDALDKFEYKLNSTSAAAKELRANLSPPLPGSPPLFSGFAPPSTSSLVSTPLTLLPAKQPMYFVAAPSMAPGQLMLSPSKPPPPPEDKKPSPPRSSFYRFQEGMLKGVGSSGDLGKQSQDLGEDTTKILKDQFSSFFPEAILQRGKAQRPRDLFHTMMKGIRNALEDAMVRRFVTEPVTELVAGWFGNLLKGPTPASSPGLLGGVGGLVANVLKFMTLSGHTGGVVGSSFGTMTLRDPAIFRNAPRLHHGLAPDEFPAILQRGERVVPKSQAGAWDRGGGVNINVTVDGSKGGSPGQNKAFGAEVARQIEAMVDARIARAAMPRGILRPSPSYA